MKGELGGKIMTEFVVLRAKMYTYRKIDCRAAQHEHIKVEEKCCQGTKKCVVAAGLTFDDYKTCLFDGEKYTGSKCSLRIRSTSCTQSIGIR